MDNDDGRHERVIVDPSGKPARKEDEETDCPRCGAPPKRRVLSAGFGSPHDVCGACGYEFSVRTIW